MISIKSAYIHAYWLGKEAPIVQTARHYLLQWWWQWQAPECDCRSCWEFWEAAQWLLVGQTVWRRHRHSDWWVPG